MAKQYWLMKVEPSAYAIDDLEKDGTTNWEGVRNYKARNYMKNDMQVGDAVLFYASNAEPSGLKRTTPEPMPPKCFLPSPLVTSVELL